MFCKKYQKLLTAVAVLLLAAISAIAQNPPPALTAISPTAGSSAGGTLVNLTGTNFLAGATVFFGPNQSPSVVFKNKASMTAVTPPTSLVGQEGTVPVIVINPDGQSSTYTVGQGGFIYDLPPTITSVAPSNGPPSGGTPETINGQYFRTVFRGVNTPPVIRFGSGICTNVFFISNAQLTCTLPPGTANATVTVSVTDPDGQVATLPNGFTYNGAISITSVQPRGGPPAGGTSVTILGTFMLQGATVSFGSVPSKSVTFVSDTQLVAIAPAQAAADVSITVQNPNQGQNITKQAAYHYTLGPVINSITPIIGANAGGTVTTLSGTGLDTVTSITYGSANGVINSKTATQLVATTPPGATGKVNVRVSGPAGADSLYNAYTYTPNAIPLSFITQGLDDAYPNIAYSQQLQATGGTPPYKWSLVGGTLPVGVTLNTTTGLVSGQAASNNYNTFNVTFQVTDSSSPKSTAQLATSFNVVFGFQVGPIPRNFFGMTLFLPADVPTIPFGSLAKGIGVSWPFLEQVKGVYNWSLLDQYVALAQSKGMDMYFTTANTPPWAVPDMSTCSVYPSFPGIFGCTAMVRNIQDWDDFLIALVKRYKGKMHMYELWNEPNVANTFTGTVPQMVQLTQHFHDIVRANDPAALIGAPSSTDEPYAQAYFAAGGTTDFDVITIHGYPNVGLADVPEAVVGFKSVNTKLLMAQLGLANKVFWDDESSWGGTNSNPDLQYRAAYASRSLLLHWSIGSQRFYWYAWDSPAWGTLWSPTGINIDGTAYQNTYNWMLGATMPFPCSQNGGTTYSAIYTCTLTRPGGYQALAVWDTNEPCSVNGGCPTHPFTAPAGYIQYRDVFGHVTPISGGVVPIGAQPVLLETSNPPALPKN